MADQDQPRNAEELTQHERVEELKRRGLKPTNFPDQDAKLLQKEFDKEFEAEREEREKRQAEEAEKRQAAEQAEKRKRQLERQLADETDAVSNNHRAAVYIDLINFNLTPPDLVVELEDTIAIRALVKTLRPNVSLRSLDLCRCNLRDDVGVELAAALQHNRAMVKLEADGNLFTSTTAKAMARLIEANDTLLSISLDHNPLSSKMANFAGVEAMAEALKTNTTLNTLSLFQTGLGAHGGKLFREALEENDTLLRLQLSNTDGIKIDDLAFIKQKLKNNRKNVLEMREKSKKERAGQRKTEEEKRKQKEEIERQKTEQEWVETQRAKRKAERETIERDEYLAELEAEKQREIREQKWREKERARKEAAAKKKGKKK